MSKRQRAHGWNRRLSVRSAVVSGAARCQAAALIVVALAIAAPASGHDLEKTQVSITFARDGTFVADVANDPSWLRLRTESIPGPFVDRVVLWVDGREVRPSSVELIPFDSLLHRPLAQGAAAEGLSIHRLRGRLPSDARTLRWFYGLVIDPYPLTIRRADGRLVVEEVAGDAWSRTIDLSGQFHGQAIGSRVAGVCGALLFLVPVALRFRSHVKGTKAI
jgi:hypothetical protein